MNHEIRTLTKEEQKQMIEQRRLQEEKQNLVGIDKDRADGYLVGFEVAKWQEKQAKIINGFLSQVTEPVFDVVSGKMIERPYFKSAQDWIDTIQADFKAGKATIAIPAKLIKANKVNVEPFAELRSGESHFFKDKDGNRRLIQSKKVKPVIVEAIDPPFDVPNNKTVYECQVNGNAIMFYVLSGSMLNIVTNAGVAIVAEKGYEGAKAKAERLKAEEAERQRLAEIERKKREAEEEERRQDAQLEKLKSLPADKFEKLMKLANG